MPKGVGRYPRTCNNCGSAFIATNGAALYCSRECGFWSKVQKKTPDECWLWVGGAFDDGYGVFWNKRSHRVAWEFTYGEIPKGLQVCHACDTPLCVNPSHLLLGTSIANIIDRDRKKRHGFGERNGRAKLSDADVRDIRRAKSAGVSGSELAKKYGMDRSQINRVARGEFWSHLD